MILRLDLLVKLLAAMVLGGVVGLERELSGKPAGLRTNILICIGSALLMDLSVRLSIGAGGERVGDPARLAAQVVSGIGFLGAGTILQARGGIIGLTTAATMWVVMAIGLTIGAGQWVEAVGGTLLVVGVLAVLGRAEQWMHSWRRAVRVTLHASRTLDYEEIATSFRAYGFVIESRAVVEGERERVYELKIRGPARLLEEALGELRRREDIIRIAQT